ncbi:MAG: hypothetical protein ACLFPE_05595, partial [Bacteroidales bacterium]
WVINADADEFWLPTKGNLKDVFDKTPADVSVVAVDRKNFVTVNRRHRHFYEDMIFREKTSMNSMGEPLLPKICHRAFPEVVVRQGNHHIAEPKNLTKMNTDEISILHFPMRSFQQFENKIKLGGAAYERNKELDTMVGKTWRKLYDEYRESGLENHYRTQVMAEADIEEGLKNGSLLIDLRLKDFFSS